MRLRTEANPFLKACAEDPVALLGDAPVGARGRPEGAALPQRLQRRGHRQQTDAYYALAQELLADGAPLQGFGAQGHLSLLYGSTSRSRRTSSGSRRSVKLDRDRGRRLMPARPGWGAGRRTDRTPGRAVRQDAAGLRQRLRLHQLHGLGLRRRALRVPGVFPEGYATIMTEEFEKSRRTTRCSRPSPMRPPARRRARRRVGTVSATSGGDDGAWAQEGLRAIVVRRVPPVRRPGGRCSRSGQEVARPVQHLDHAGRDARSGASSPEMSRWISGPAAKARSTGPPPRASPAWGRPPG